MKLTRAEEHALAAGYLDGVKSGYEAAISYLTTVGPIKIVGPAIILLQTHRPDVERYAQEAIKEAVDGQEM